ncbi:MAG TPA: hypothetical protein VKB34_22800 [Povalibacter sp.]|nr:hypothetical protein [Povalibacter sp.]
MLQTLPRVLTIGFMVLVGSLSLLTARIAAADRPPSQADVDFAMEAADLLQAELIAALLQEFSETTPQNVEHGKLAISLIFDDDNKALRLVGEIDPLGRGNTPRDNFEADSLALALTGVSNEAVQKVQGQYYFRRSIPLSNFSPACVMCHSAFGPTDPSKWVGALMLRVPTSSKGNHDRH